VEHYTSKSSNRILWLDLARCFAIISISSNHAVNRAFRSAGTSYDAFNTLSTVDNVLHAVIFVFSRMGVPIFLMISGALLLEKKMDNSGDVKKFYKHNLLSILITSEIWYFLMFWYRTLFHSNNSLRAFGILYAIRRCIGTMLFINQVTMGNMWYIPMILCIYLVIPMFNIVVHKIDNRLFALPLGVVIMSSMIIPNLNQMTEIMGKDLFIDFNLKSANVFSMFMIYVLSGFFIKRGILEKASDISVLLVTSLSFVLCVLFQYWEYSMPGDNDINYDFFMLAICCCLTFEIMRRFTNGSVKSELYEYISKISFGIFFVHIFIVSAIAGAIPFSGVNRIIVFLILEVVSVAGSIAVIFILAKIPILKKYLFLIKD